MTAQDAIPPLPGRERRSLVQLDLDRPAIEGTSGQNEAYEATMRRRQRVCIMRQRFKRARWIMAVLGVLGMAVLVASAHASIQAAGSAPTRSFQLAALLALAAGAVLPWYLVEWLWRQMRRQLG